jgi:hypothetical protein
MSHAVKYRRSNGMKAGQLSINYLLSASYYLQLRRGSQVAALRVRTGEAFLPHYKAEFLKLRRRIFARRAKCLLSSFFFYAKTNLFLGRLRAPPDGFNNPPDTRNRPGERFLCTSGAAVPSSPRRVFDRTGGCSPPYKMPERQVSRR